MRTVVEHVVVDDALIDIGDPHAVIDPVWWTAKLDEDQYNESLRKFSREQRHLLAIAWHLAEVNNGGHDQFFFNPTGIVWEDALAGYKEAGLAAAASILEQSVARMGGKPSFDQETRQEQLESLKPDFDDLDDAFYALQESTDFDAAMMSYILAHREAFYFSGDVLKTKLP